MNKFFCKLHRRRRTGKPDGVSREDAWDGLTAWRQNLFSPSRLRTWSCPQSKRFLQTPSSSTRNRCAGRIRRGAPVVTFVLALLTAASLIFGDAARSLEADGALFAGDTLERLLAAGPTPSETACPCSDASEAPSSPEKEDSSPVTEAPGPKQSPEAEEHSGEADPQGGQIDAASLLEQAKGAEDQGDHAQALEKSQRALDQAEKNKNRKQQASALEGLARVCHHVGREDQALNFVNRSISIHQELKNARARSLAHLLAGRILVSQGNHSEALTSFEQSLKLLPESEASKRPGLFKNMASCLQKMDKPTAALAWYGRLLAVLTRNGDREGAAQVHLLIGEMKVSRSDFAGAKIHFKKAEALFRELNSKRELGATLFRLAYVDQMSGDFKAAADAIEQGRSLLSEESDTGFDALPLLVKGLNAFAEGSTALAVKSLTGALNRYREADDRTMAARTRLALGQVEAARARMKSALEHGGTALTEFRALGDSSGEAAALHLISDVYFQQGFVQKALEYAQESLAIARKINDTNQVIRGRILLAHIHTTLGDMDFAGKLLKEAVDDARTRRDRRVIGEVRLAAARYLFAREASEKAFKEVSEAHKDFVASNCRLGVPDCEHLLGLIHETRGEREQALNMLNRSLQQHRAMWDRFGEGADLAALGVHYKNLGDYKEAMAYFRQAMALRKSIGDRRGYAASLTNIGNLLKHQGNMPDALNSLEQALEIYREMADKKGEADLLTNLANVHAAGRSFAAALENLKRALEIHQSIHDLRGMATDLASMGSVHLASGNVDEAGNCLKEADKVNKRISNPRGELAILAETAMLEKARKNPGSALSILEKALTIALKTHDARAASSINLKMAAVLQDMGRYDKALAVLEKTIEEMKRVGDRRGELWALGELGIIQVKTEDFENALKNLNRALKLRSELDLPVSQTREIDFYLAEIYEGFKDYERALEHYHKALAMAQIAGTDSLLGQIYDRIGNIHYQIEEYAKARDFFEDALRIHSETKNHTMQKSELIRLGDILSKLGDLDGALKYQLKALAITRETGDKRTESRILTRIGTLHQMLGRPGTALENYKEALELRTETGDNRGVNENLLQISLVTSILGNFETAISHLRRAFEMSNCSEDRSMQWKAYFIMGRALQGKNRLGEALEAYRKAIVILEATEADIIEESDEDNFIFGGKTALFETMLNVLMRLAGKDPEGAYESQALRIVERLKAAEFENGLSRTNVEHFSGVPRSLVIREKSLKLGLRKLNARLEEALSGPNPDKARIDRLIEERKAKEQLFMKLKARLAKDYPEYAALRYPRPMSVHHLQRAVLDPDEAVLEFMVTRSRTYIFAVDKHRFRTYSVKYSLEELERDVGALLRPLYRADTLSSWDPSIAYKLYSRMIKPVEHFLTGRKTVVIVPHGPLSAVPFDMLVSSQVHEAKRFWSAKEPPKYLVEKYAFSYVPSVSLLAYLRTKHAEPRAGWTMAAFGDAVYRVENEEQSELNPGAEKLLASLQDQSGLSRSRGLEPLPGSKREINEILKIVGGPVQRYSGAQATESLFKKADLSRYGYIHLATHGLMLNGAGKLWQQPAIVFSLYGDRENDGFLQLGEVFGLRLNADLVVLSSCLLPAKGTFSSPTGLLGLSRAFFFAGADSVILSMWQVNDESTATLFIDMYDQLRNGSKAEALRKAKIKLLNNPATAHPYYWAPFVLMGKWHVTNPPGLHKVDPQEVRFKGLSTWRRLFTR